MDNPLPNIIFLLLGFSAIIAACSLLDNTPDGCKYENLYTYAQETLIAPDPNMFATQVDYFRAAVQYADNGTWATLEDGTQCKIIN